MNHYSLKKIDELNAEVPVRRELAKRVGGVAVESEQVIHRNGDKYYITRVMCIGGTCECGCNQPTHGILEPHHKIRRSAGGAFTLENIIMVKWGCHRRLDGRNPQFHWLPKP